MFCWVDSSICQTAAAPVVLRVLNLHTSRCKRTKTWALLPTMCQALGWELEVPWWVRPSPASRVSVQLVGRETAVFLLKWHERAVHKIHKKKWDACIIITPITHFTSFKWRKMRLAEYRMTKETKYSRNNVVHGEKYHHFPLSPGCTLQTEQRWHQRLGVGIQRWSCRGVLHVNWLEFYLFWEWQQQIYGLESPHYSALGQDLQQRNQVSIWIAPIGEE